MSNKYPQYITQNLARDRDYYSLTNENIEKCKIDAEYLGDVMTVNENLIWHSVHKYINKPEIIVKSNCIEKDDILQLGRMGFIKAIKAFDTTRGIKFSSFAVTAIVREIRCFLRDSGSIIRPTRTAKDLINRINHIENDLGYMPSVDELGDLLDEDKGKIVKALQVGRPIKYLDETIARTDDMTLLDMIDCSEEVEEDIVQEIFVSNVIEALTEKLTPLELDVLKMRLHGLSQTHTANKENISPMKVSRIMKKIAGLIQETPELMDLLKSS